MPPCLRNRAEWLALTIASFAPITASAGQEKPAPAPAPAVAATNDGRVRFYRTVYSGRRNGAPIAFYERQHQAVGPIFSLTVSGSF